MQQQHQQPVPAVTAPAPAPAPVPDPLAQLVQQLQYTYVDIPELVAMEDDDGGLCM